MATRTAHHISPEIFSAVPYFADIIPVCTSTCQKLRLDTLQLSYNTGEVVFLEGESCAGLHIIQEGWVKAVKISWSGREQILRFIGPGDVFNAVGAFISSGQNPATAIALEPVTAWLIPKEVLLNAADQCPRLTRIIMQRLAERVQHLTTLVEDLSLRTVEARVARRLLEKSTEGSVQRLSWATQTEIAARLGTVPDVISRIFRGLAKEDLICVERNEIRILDRPGLEAKAILDKYFRQTSQVVA